MYFQESGQSANLIFVTFKAQKQPPKLLYKKFVLKNFAKFTGKHLCQSVSATLLKARLWCRCFPVVFAKFLRTPIFIKHLWWLHLYFFLSHHIFTASNN